MTLKISFLFLYFTGSWVGMIKSIDLTLTLKFSDGSICEISDEDASELEDLTGVWWLSKP